MIGTAVALGIAGAAASAAGGIAGGAIQAGAQQGIANAQQAAAQAAQKQALAFAAPTAQELTTLQNQISLYNQQYSSSQGQLQQLERQLTDTYGPNIMAQGQQLHEALSGQASGMALDYNQQRARSRSQLEQQLTSQLGPGALTSSVGLQALQNFDFQTNTNYAAIQDQAINSMVGRLGALAGDQSNALGNIQNINAGLRASLGQIQGTENAFQTRQIAAANSTNPSVIGSAGSQYVGQNAFGQGLGAASSALGQGLGFAGMMNAFGNGGQQNQSSGGGTPISENSFGSMIPSANFMGSLPFVGASGSSGGTNFGAVLPGSNAGSQGTGYTQNNYGPYLPQAGNQ